MKSYNEMAQSVLERAQVQIKRKKKMRIMISSVAAGCLAILMICVFVGGGETPALPLGGGDTPVSPSVGGQLSVAQQCFLQPVCYSNGAISVGSLEQRIPMQFLLEATDVQGRTEAEIEQIRRDKMQSYTQMEQAWAEEGYAYRISVTHKDDSVIVYAATGGFCLDVQDWTKVKEIRGKCESEYGKIQCAIYAKALSTKNISYRLVDENGKEHLVDKPVYRHGNCWIYGQNIIIPGDSLQEVYKDIQSGEGSLLFSWEPNQALFDALAADVNFDLPQISFSFTLCYEDGTEVEHDFIAESHDGVGYIMYAN